MKTRRYNTLSGLMRQCGRNGFSLYDFLSGHACLGGKWQKFTLSPNLRAQVLEMFAGVVWSRRAKENSYKLELMRNYGILDRLVINVYDGKYIPEYVAGQNYTAEIRYIQDLAR